MDADRFDTLTRSITTARSRRSALGGLLIGALGLFGWTDAQDVVAKNCKKIKDKKKRKTCLKKAKDTTNQPPVALSPPPPAPTCSDGIKNGSETDVDCGGGTCQRCANGKKCVTANDCANACTGGICGVCATRMDCGSDASGQCECEAPFAGGARTCNSRAGRGGPIIATCAAAACPTGTTCVQGTPGVFCAQPCGAP